MSGRRRFGQGGLEHEPALGARGDERSVESGLVGDEPALAAMGDGLGGFAKLYAERRAATSPVTRFWVVLAAILVAGPLGILGALFGVLGGGSIIAFAVLGSVVIGPLVEETVKAASALWLTEVKPWLVPAAWVLVVITVAGGLGFAVIENWVYLNIYIDDPTETIVRWRWIFGPTVHGIASLVAGIGVARAWTRIHTHGETRAIYLAGPYIAGAAVFHGAYNALALILEAAGVV